MKKTPLARKTPLRAKQKPSKPRKPLSKTNRRQVAKRKARMKSWYSSAEWKRQRKESLELAWHQCEYAIEARSPLTGIVYSRHRCPETTGLQVHELRYKFEKSEPKDRVVLCKAHHEYVEMTEHPTRRRR